MPNFPELRDRFKSIAAGFRDDGIQTLGSIVPEVEPVDTETKSTSLDIAFDPTLIGLSNDWYARHGYDRIFALLQGQNPGWAAEVVSMQTAQNLAPVWAARQLLCGAYASLPFELIQEKIQGTNIDAQYRRDLPIWDIFWNGNDERSGVSIRETLVSHLLFSGNAFARVYRRSGSETAIDLEVITPENILPAREKYGQQRLMYTVHQRGRSDQDFFVTPGRPHDILHIRGLSNDGLIGISVLSAARQSLGTSLAQEKNLAKFYAQGGRGQAIFKKAAKFRSDQEADEFREKWSNRLRDPWVPPILEGTDITYDPVGNSFRDMQFLELRAYSAEEMARWFYIPPPLLHVLDKSSYAVMEQCINLFKEFTMGPLAKRMGADFRRCVLTPAERRQGIRAHHDLDAVSLSTFLQKIQAYSQAAQNGFFSINEVRAKLGEQRVEGLDNHLVQSQNIPALMGGTAMTPAENIAAQDDAAAI